jgi:hypothetical protein
MQLHSELNLQASRTKAATSSPRRRKTLATRKVTIRLAEKLHAQLEAATERPGVGKSMVVAAALESFLNPRPPAEDPLRQRFDEMNTRFDALERGLRVIAETVALAVAPPLQQPARRTACNSGGLEAAIAEDPPCARQAGHYSQATSEGVDIEYASSAAAGEGGSNSYFHRRRNAFCRPA